MIPPIYFGMSHSPKSDSKSPYFQNNSANNSFCTNASDREDINNALHVLSEIEPTYLGGTAHFQIIKKGLGAANRRGDEFKGRGIEYKKVSKEQGHLFNVVKKLSKVGKEIGTSQSGRKTPRRITEEDRGTVSEGEGLKSNSNPFRNKNKQITHPPVPVPAVPAWSSARSSSQQSTEPETKSKFRELHTTLSIQLGSQATDGLIGIIRIGSEKGRRSLEYKSARDKLFETYPGLAEALPKLEKEINQLAKLL